MTNDATIQQFNNRANMLKLAVKSDSTSFEEASSYIEGIVEDYIEMTGERPPALLPTHYDITKKVGKFKQRKNGSITTLEELGNLLFFILQKDEQEEAREAAAKRTEIEWAQLEKRMKQHSDCSYEHIVNELKRYVEAGVITKKKAKKIQADFKECEFYRCGNAFYVGNGGFHRKAKYCSYKCYVDADNAKRRKKKTNTQLTQEEYIPRFTESEEREYRMNRLNYGIVELEKTKEYKPYSAAMHEMRVQELIKMNKEAPVVTYYLNEQNQRKEGSNE